MKNCIIRFSAIFLLVFGLTVGVSILSAYADDVFVGTGRIIGDPSTGIRFDSNNDGTSDVIFLPDGTIQSENLEERITGQYGEYIDFNDQADDSICFGGQGGERDTDLCFKLDGEQPSIYSPKDESILIHESLKVWLQAGKPTNIIIQSNGSQNAALLFNEYTATRGEIFSKGENNSFHINSLHPSGLHLNADTSFKVTIANGGGKTAIGHSNPRTVLDINGATTFQKASEPGNPAEGSFVIWMSNGGGAGNPGDIMIKTTHNSSTQTTTLVKFK